MLSKPSTLKPAQVGAEVCVLLLAGEVRGRSPAGPAGGVVAGNPLRSFAMHHVVAPAAVADRALLQQCQQQGQLLQGIAVAEVEVESQIGIPVSAALAGPGGWTSRDSQPEPAGTRQGTTVRAPWTLFTVSEWLAAQMLQAAP
jgi:hypothetical protein